MRVRRCGGVCGDGGVYARRKKGIKSEDFAPVVGPPAYLLRGTNWHVLARKVGHRLTNKEIWEEESWLARLSRCPDLNCVYPGGEVIQVEHSIRASEGCYTSSDLRIINGHSNAEGRIRAVVANKLSS